MHTTQSSPRIARVGVAHDVLVEARLGGRLLGVVVGAEAELEESHVVGGQLHAHLDHLVLLVLPGDDAFAVHAAGLVRPRLQRNNDIISFLIMLKHDGTLDSYGTKSF